MVAKISDFFNFTPFFFLNLVIIQHIKNQERNCHSIHSFKRIFFLFVIFSYPSAVRHSLELRTPRSNVNREAVLLSLLILVCAAGSLLVIGRWWQALRIDHGE
jgi:hypothetical protein